MGMILLIFVAAETGVCVPLPSKLTSASAAIPAFRPCLPSRCLAVDYSFTICFDSQLKQLFPFLIVLYSSFVIMYPNEQSYMPNDSANIEKHIKTYLLNTCVFSINPGSQGYQMSFLTSIHFIHAVTPRFIYPPGKCRHSCARNIAITRNYCDEYGHW
jgi:hypothetical protein